MTPNPATRDPRPPTSKSPRNGAGRGRGRLGRRPGRRRDRKDGLEQQEANDDGQARSRTQASRATPREAGAKGRAQGRSGRPWSQRRRNPAGFARRRAPRERGCAGNGRVLAPAAGRLSAGTAPGSASAACRPAPRTSGTRLARAPRAAPAAEPASTACADSLRGSRPARPAAAGCAPSASGGLRSGCRHRRRRDPHRGRGSPASRRRRNGRRSADRCRAGGPAA